MTLVAFSKTLLLFKKHPEKSAIIVLYGYVFQISTQVIENAKCKSLHEFLETNKLIYNLGTKAPLVIL